MDSQKQQLIEKLNTASNILVTVSSNPTVDQLSACIGLTVMLDEIGKRAVAVYSGDTPSAIEFLQPGSTIEKNTDSLRDFIISFSKAKADKLRYKVEDDVVRIYVTPYKTALSDKDLEFTQGDFNIDAIVALGVKQQEELDQVITAHGRILHDATIITVNNTAGSEIGAVNWVDSTASSLCELVTSLASSFDKYKMDEQVATALLTGIVSETDRFSNKKTTATTMTASAALIAAGANQQLVATELSKSEVSDIPAQVQADQQPKVEADDGSLKLSHDEEVPKPELAIVESDTQLNPDGSEISIDNEGTLHKVQDGLMAGHSNPVFTAAGQADYQESQESSANPLTEPESSQEVPLLTHNDLSDSSDVISQNEATNSNDSKTLAELEAEASAKPVQAQMADNVNPSPALPPIVALNAQPLGDQLHNEPSPGLTPADKAMDMPLPPVPDMPIPNQSGSSQPQQLDSNVTNTPPPPVPPPMIPPFPQS